MGVKWFSTLSSRSLHKEACRRFGNHCHIWTRWRISLIAGKGMWGPVQLSWLLYPSNRKAHQSSTALAFRVRQKALCVLAEFCPQPFAISLGNRVIINLAAQWCCKWGTASFRKPPACVFLERLVSLFVSGLKSSLLFLIISKAGR